MTAPAKSHGFSGSLSRAVNGGRFLEVSEGSLGAYVAGLGSRC